MFQARLRSLLNLLTYLCACALLVALCGCASSATAG
jgi:hypothetical protein